MCTLTWAVDDEGVRIHFNRDESRRRLPARPPAVLEAGERRILAPRDGDAGGTWLGANDAGLALAVLNGYHHEAAAPPPVAPRSRGLLVLDLLELASLEEVETRIARLDLGAYRPFELAGFAVGRSPRRFAWDGRRLSTSLLAPEARPIVSSSFKYEDVRWVRRALFVEMVVERGESLDAFHRSHRPTRGAYSPCMHREDACTVSYAIVAIDESSAHMSYAAGAPCEAGTSSEARVSLALAS